MTATVTLIGGGPGDPALVTDAARAALATADVVIHDRLSPPELLDLAPADAERIDAGKRRGDHKLTQDEINELLVQHGRAGKRVVRLKGGDPFLYGRGGEEAIACREAGLEVSLVPGITSALAVPAYAGIPVTHRGVSETVTVITGHRREPANPVERRELERETDTLYRWLSGTPGTLVILMGLARLHEISRDLQRHGMAGSTPCAVISHGTTSRQQTVTGTLRNIASAVESAGVTSPAIIVVGEVVRLREQIAWFERRPLFGTQVAVTRARAQASGLAAQLRQLGAEVIEAPAISSEPLPHDDLDRALAELGSGMFLVLTSATAAAIVLDRLRATGQDARALAGVRIAAVGTATSARLEAAGLTPDVVPPGGARTSAGLADALAQEALYGAHVIYPCAETRAPVLEERLSELGAKVHALPAYRTVVGELDPATCRRVLAADVVTFTSGSTVSNLMGALPAGSALPPAVSIGPVTSAACAEAGIEVAREAAEPDVASLVVAVLEYAEVRSRRSVTPASPDG